MLDKDIAKNKLIILYIINNFNHELEESELNFSDRLAERTAKGEAGRRHPTQRFLRNPNHRRNS